MTTSLTPARRRRRRLALLVAALALVLGSGTVLASFYFVVGNQGIYAPTDTAIHTTCDVSGYGNPWRFILWNGVTGDQTSASCYPYGCDRATGTCHTDCQSDSDCYGAGGRCNVATGQCVLLDRWCKDTFTVVNAAGQETSCAPYECQAGLCRGTCETSNDCAPGYQCYQGSQRKYCYY